VKKFAVAACLVFLSLSTVLRAQPVRVDAVEVELLADQSAARPGQQLMLGLRIRHDP
jgi:hypothetical protein